ncbi:MAG: DUF1624 domain-containing protein [Clostridia bacterium]|nr:DUF1624 domain-containing protein [Clostridia bacterium]
MSSKTRYHLLDALRGLAVLCMVVFHGIYLYQMLFGDAFSDRLYRFFLPAEPFFAAFFIFLSGLCCTLSHSNLRRGAKLAVVALLVTVVTLAAGKFGLEVAIYFGVLHLLAFCILFCALFHKPLSKIPALLGILLSLVLFLIFYPIESGNLWLLVTRYPLPAAWYSTDFLFWLGLPKPSFSSADYFPVLPWLFIFLAGFFTGLLCKKRGFPAFFRAKPLPFLGTVGRNALLIYILHQPILYSVFMLLKR